MKLVTKHIAKFVIIFVLITGFAFDLLIPLINNYPFIFILCIGIALIFIVRETANPDVSYAKEHYRMLVGTAGLFFYFGVPAILVNVTGEDIEAWGIPLILGAIPVFILCMRPILAYMRLLMEFNNQRRY